VKDNMGSDIFSTESLMAISLSQETQEKTVTVTIPHREVFLLYLL